MTILLLIRTVLMYVDQYVGAIGGGDRYCWYYTPYRICPVVVIDRKTEKERRRVGMVLPMLTGTGVHAESGGQQEATSSRRNPPISVSFLVC